MRVDLVMPETCAARRAGYARLARFTAFTAAAIGLGFLGCASTDVAQTEWTGCYYFDQNELFRELRLPWGIRLEGELLGEDWPAAKERNARRAVTLTGTREQGHPFGYWIPMGEDSLEIGYPGGGGLLLKVGIEPDRGLSGVAIPVGDAIDPLARGGTRPTHPVHLTWARCP